MGTDRAIEWEDAKRREAGRFDAEESVGFRSRAMTGR